MVRVTAYMQSVSNCLTCLDFSCLGTKSRLRRKLWQMTCESLHEKESATNSFQESTAESAAESNKYTPRTPTKSPPRITCRKRSMLVTLNPCNIHCTRKQNITKILLSVVVDNENVFTCVKHRNDKFKFTGPKLDRPVIGYDVESSIREI